MIVMSTGPDFKDIPESDEHQHSTTPKDALLDALAECEVTDPFKDILIIYNTKSGRSGSFDSGLTLNEGNMLCDLYKAWLINGALGVIMGSKADAVMKSFTGEEEEEDDEPRT